MNADPIVTTASAATIRALKYVALEYAAARRHAFFVERLLDIVNLRKRYNKKWQHQL